MSRRFDYVKFDEQATAEMTAVKCAALNLEVAIEHNLRTGRAKAMALTKLEEACMWAGRAIRDHQVARTYASDEPARSNE